MIYTRGLTSFVTGGLVLWVYWDPQGLARFRSAFGVESRLWLGTWAVAAVVLAFWLSSTIALRLYLYKTIKIHKAEPLEPGEAGLLDIPYWSSVAAFAGVVAVMLRIEPGALARWRPAVIVLLTSIGAVVVAGRLAVAAAAAVHGPSTVRKAITRKQCAKRYSGGRQCGNWAFRWCDACRWHINAIETAQRYGRRVRTRQTLGAGWLCLGLFALTKWMGEIEMFWAALAVAAMGAGIRLVAEGIIAPYYALSQLTIWPRAQALGLVLQAAGATAMLFVVGLRPESARPLVALLGDNEVWLAFGPAVVYIAAAALTTVGWDVLTARVLHYQAPSMASVVVLGSLLPMWRLLEAPVLRYSPLGRWTVRNYWAPVLGQDHPRALPFAYVGAWATAELVASLVAVRRRRKPQTTLVRSAACALAALLSMLGARYILQWSGASGIGWFVALTVMLSAVVCSAVLWLRGRLPVAATADRS